MIANPKLRAFRYDPYEKKLTEEFYDHEQMLKTRLAAIEHAKEIGKFGLILGTLGRQGNLNVLKNLETRINLLGKKNVIILLSEIFPDKIKLFKGVDAFIQVVYKYKICSLNYIFIIMMNLYCMIPILQIACPRLSIDWGTAFEKPFLTPYEGAAALKMINFNNDKPYPMDFYASASLGPWTPNYKESELEKQTNTCCGKCKDKT